MPAIQLYQQHTNAGGSLNVSSPDIGGQTAQAVGNIGGALSGIGAERNAVVREQAERDAKSWSGATVSKATLDWTETLQKRQESALPGAPDFTPGVLSDFDAYASKAVDSAPTKMAKDFVRQHMQSLRTSVGEQALRFEGQARVGLRLDNAEGSIENAAKVVAQDPGQFNKMLGLVRETMPDVGPAHTAELSDKARKQLVAAAAASNIQTSPDRAYNEIYRSLHPMLSQPSTETPGETGSHPERGLRNNNPGNLRKTGRPWEGETMGEDPSFSSFKTPEAGIRALGKNLLAYQDSHGINTVEGIVSRWAPATENDTASYVNSVAKAVGVAPGDALDMHDPKVLKAVASAIIKHENGKQPYQDSTIDAGIKSALGAPLPADNPNSIAAVAQPGVGALVKPNGEPVKTGVPWVDAMTVPERLHFLQAAATEQQRYNSKLQTGLKAQERDLNAMVLSGVAPPDAAIPKESAYIAAYGQVDGPAHYQENVTDMVRLGEGIRSLQTASPLERRAMIQSAAPEPGAGYDHKQKLQGALIKANEIIEKQLADDPADYVLRTSPAVKSAALALQNADGDPIATLAYVNAMNAEQTRLGVTSPDSPGKTIQQPKLLTASQANAVIGQFYDQSKGGAKAADLIAGLEQQWGPAWPQVYGQLATDNKLPPAALVIPIMSDAGAKSRMAAASVVKDEDFKKSMAPSDPKDIRESLLSQFGDARTTFAAQGVDGVSTLGKLTDQAEKLAYYYRVQGKSTSEAAKQAFNEVIGWKYDFIDSFRVPKTEQPKYVSEGASYLLKSIKGEDLMPINEPGVPQDRLQELTRDAVSNNGTWVTNGDESGMRLMIQGKNGQMVQVQRVDGSPMNFSWKELRDKSLKYTIEARRAAAR